MTILFLPPSPSTGSLLKSVQVATAEVVKVREENYALTEENVVSLLHLLECVYMCCIWLAAAVVSAAKSI